MLSEYDEHESADNDFGSLVVGSGGADDANGGGGGGAGGGGGGTGGNNVSNNGVDGISRSVEARSDLVVETTDAGEDCGSSTEPSIGLTPDDESPSLGTYHPRGYTSVHILIHVHVYASACVFVCVCLCVFIYP